MVFLISYRFLIWIPLFLNLCMRLIYSDLRKNIGREVDTKFLSTVETVWEDIWQIFIFKELFY